jgi:predicted component of type VI protein secretion system
MNVREQLFGQKLQRVSRRWSTCSHVDRLIEPDEGGLAAALGDAQRLERGADRAGLAAVRVEVDLGVGDALLDVVDLGLERGQVLLGAALQHEHPPSSLMRGIWTTYCQTFLGSTSARPASSSSRE